MGFGAIFDKTFSKVVEGNEALGKVASTLSSGRAGGMASAAGSYASRVGSTLKSTYNTGGFALKAGMGAAAGGAAGYAYDGTDGSAMKGALLGAGGAAAHTGWRSPGMRGLASEAASAGRGAFNDARGWAGNQYKRQVNAMHVRQAGRAGWTQ